MIKSLPHQHSKPPNNAAMYHRRDHSTMMDDVSHGAPTNTFNAYDRVPQQHVILDSVHVPHSAPPSHIPHATSTPIFDSAHVPRAPPPGAYAAQVGPMQGYIVDGAHVPSQMPPGSHHRPGLAEVRHRSSPLFRTRNNAASRPGSMGSGQDITMSGPMGMPAPSPVALHGVRSRRSRNQGLNLPSDFEEDQPVAQVGHQRQGSSKSAGGGADGSGGTHEWDPDQVLRSATGIGSVENQIARLQREEAALLETPGLSDEKMREIKEVYFHRIMDLMLELPGEEMKRLMDKQQDLGFAGAGAGAGAGGGGGGGGGGLDRPRKQLHILRNRTLRRNVLGETSTVHRVYFCWGIALLWVVMLFVTLAEADWTLKSVDQNPLLGTDMKAIDALGAKNVDKLRNGGQAHRLITPLFLHTGIIHCVLNLIFLYRLAWDMETSYGHWRIICIFILSGAFGIIISSIMTPNTVTTCSTGGLFGLLGALFGDFIQNHHYMIDDDEIDDDNGELVHYRASGGGSFSGKFKYLVELIFVTLLGLALGVLPLLDNWANIGAWLYGVISGLAFMTGIVHGTDGKAARMWYSTPLILLSVIMQVGMWLTALAIFGSASDTTKWCNFCTRLSCMDSPFWSCQIEEATFGSGL